MNSETIITVHTVIHGRVQGVSYRAWTKANARKRGLAGWVRNRRDGTVEAVFHGPESEVSNMLEACKKGPLAAKVKNIETAPFTETSDGLSGFHVKETV